MLRDDMQSECSIEDLFFSEGEEGSEFGLGESKPLLRGGDPFTPLKDLDLLDDKAVRALSGSYVRGMGGMPLGTWRFLCLLYFCGFWFWSLVNASEGSSDRLFIQMSNMNLMITIAFLTSACYYSFRISNVIPNLSTASTGYDLWLPHFTRVLFETSFSISMVLFVFFWISEYHSSFTKGIDLIFAVNEHCVIAFVVFIDLFINRIMFQIEDLFAVVLLTVIALISDAYATATYGVLPEMFSSAEVTLVIYISVILFSIVTFILGLAIKRVLFTRTNENSIKSKTKRRKPDPLGEDLETGSGYEEDGVDTNPPALSTSANIPVDMQQRKVKRKLIKKKKSKNADA